MADDAGAARTASAAEGIATTVTGVPIDALRRVDGEFTRVCADDEGITLLFSLARDLDGGVRVEFGNGPGAAFRTLAHLRVLYGPEAHREALIPFAETVARALAQTTPETLRARLDAVSGPSLVRLRAWQGWEYFNRPTPSPGTAAPVAVEHAPESTPVDASQADLPPPPPEAMPAAWLAWALGVDGDMVARCNLTLDLTSRDGQAVVFELKDPRARRYTLRLDPPSATAPAFLRLPTGNLSYSPEDGYELLRPLLDRARAVLPLRPFANVRAAVATSVAFRPGMDQSRVGGVRDGLHETWRHPDRWRVFLADREIARGYDSSLQFNMPYVRIEHGPDECQYSGFGDTIRYPWRSRAERSTVRPDVDFRSLVRSKKAGAFVTDMDDMDVIHGARAKVDKILELVNQQLEPQFVVVNCTCVPTMTGDDVKGAAAEARRCSKYPIVYRDQTPNSFGPYINEVARSIPSARIRPVDASALNLVGFPPGPGRNEITTLLGALGLRVNAQAVPSLDPEELSRWLDAATQLYLEDAAWDSLALHLFGKLPIAMVKPPAPYGLRGTRSFLLAVGRALQVDGTEARVAAALAESSAQFTAMTARAAGLGLGFVVSPEELERLASPPRFFGIPMVSLLDEMGFALRLAVYSPEGITPPFPWRDLAANPERHAVSTFADAAGLEAFLRRDDIHAVYSDYGYDHRIVGAGKASFAADLFEIGPAAAIEALRRLITLCRLPFFRDHGRLLRRDSAVGA